MESQKYQYWRPTEIHTSLPKTRQNALSSLLCEKSIVSEEDNDQSVPELHTRTSSSCSKVVFWSSKVKKELLKLDVNEASGLDDDPALVLEMTAPELAPPLARLFQIILCFDKGYLPAQWKCEHVIPCYKKGDKQTPGNYRPISLLCIMSKVMEELVSKKMWKHLDQHHQISPFAVWFHSWTLYMRCFDLCQLTQQKRRSTSCLPWHQQSFWPCVAPWSGWETFCTRVFRYSSCLPDRLSQR